MKQALLTLIFTLISCSYASADTFIADQLGRIQPQIHFQLIPSEYKSALILGGNENSAGGVITFSFQEEKGYSGFSAMVCDEDNTARYHAGQKADCLRREINRMEDTLSFSFKGDETYNLLVINRTQPINIDRDIEVTSYVTSPLNPAQKKAINAGIEKFNDALHSYFGTAPFNVAIVPCHAGYVPSSYITRTLTICSEFITGAGIIPDMDLLQTALTYEVTPELMRDWGLSQDLQTETERLEFAAALNFIFSSDIGPYSTYVQHHRDIIGLGDIYQNYLLLYKQKETLPYTDRVRTLIAIHNKPFEVVDPWFRKIYHFMADDKLRGIMDGSLKHFGTNRNFARLEIKKRLQEKLE